MSSSNTAHKAVHTATGDAPLPEALADPGVVRNTVLQLASQLASATCTSALTLFLVRSLGASGYGVYALAANIGALVFLFAGLGLPVAIGRLLAEHRSDVGQARAIFALGMKVQAPAALLAGLSLIALSGPLVSAYGDPQLTWPLRWMGCVVVFQALFTYLTSSCTSVRRVSTSLRMVIIESVTETGAAIALVVAGAGAAGALMGRAVGYAVAVAAGLYLTLRLFGSRERHGVLPKSVTLRSIMSYSGALLLVDATWSAIARVDVLLIGAMLTSAAVGSFSAVLRIMTLLGYLGMAVSGGVAPRVARGGGQADTRSFNQAIRYLLIVQGLAIAPMLIWSKPIIGLLLGPGYGSAVDVMRVLTVQAFVTAPASLISVSVSYLGEGRRRVLIMVGILAIGLISTYLLLRVAGLVGAAAADDLVAVLYVSGHLWLCRRLIAVDIRRLAWSTARTLMAAAAMTLPLLVAGVNHLSPVSWVLGSCVGVAAYVAVLLASRELTVAELRLIAVKLLSASLGKTWLRGTS
jgi:O-antigen/teichoic acid export membrane protein